MKFPVKQAWISSLLTSALLPALLVAGLLFWSSNAQAQEHGAAEGHGEPAAHGAEGHHGPEGAPTINWTDLGYGDKNEAGKPITEGGSPMAPPLLFALFNFAVFAGILYWKAGPSLSKYLANRHEQIKDALEEGAKLQAEAKEKLKEYSERIADADKEVNELIAQIKKDAEAERAKLISDAQVQAKRMQQDAEARIESEFLAARRQLEREVVAKAVEVATTILKEKSSSADQGNLFSAFIADIKTASSTAGPAGSNQGGQA
jgi:F-type H+-transporting ATPase subunit b